MLVFGYVSYLRLSSFLTVYKYIASLANTLISWTLFPPPPNLPGIVEVNNGGGPISGGDSLGNTDDGENTGDGDGDSDCM
jgi:hypothetical protein